MLYECHTDIYKGLNTENTPKPTEKHTTNRSIRKIGTWAQSKQK